MGGGGAAGGDAAAGAGLVAAGAGRGPRRVAREGGRLLTAAWVKDVGRTWAQGAAHRTKGPGGPSLFYSHLHEGLPRLFCTWRGQGGDLCCGARPGLAEGSVTRTLSCCDQVQGGRVATRHMPPSGLAVPLPAHLCA